MGRRGPVPTPTNILRLRGSFKAGRREGEPQPPTGEPDPPRGLQGEALDEWNRVTAALRGMGILSSADAGLLYALAERWQAYRDAVALEQGLPKDADYRQRKVLANCVNGALDRYHKLAVEFGLSPAARTRVRVAPKEERKTGAARFAMQ